MMIFSNAAVNRCWKWGDIAFQKIRYRVASKNLRQLDIQLKATLLQIIQASKLLMVG